ncbi:c-type cytochrome [Benzoatithermus flavus]|uniref:Cytochrome c family protein n=1 Tax=Benzoatithermus flavus TaxID=3108223 RepID=A0ABU8XV88_9PROT
MKHATVFVLGIVLLAAGPALADTEAGEKVFKKCQTCHEVKAEKNKVGPHLVGIVGRPAGSVADFKYSDAMKSSGITWTEENLAKYLKDPKGFIPGNKMAFAGLKKDEEIVDVIAYLKQPES